MQAKWPGGDKGEIMESHDEQTGAETPVPQVMSLAERV